ncbi:hypothetical protein [uncultured Bacteroides sp.]|uniref:hypothetical protein n=1 Tax=uncultured Bacteroides sp. TaxID=162156 RepID=UPI002622D67B|nr:hypothetical protein [uncultured Bacteroides sp.]
MRLKGYHNTEVHNIESILKDGFLCEHNPKHWLGQGIYFFADADTAIVNIDMLHHKDKITTIIAEIDIEDSAYLDLDLRQNNNAFRNYCKTKAETLKATGQELILKGTDKRQAAQIYKCFFMDLFKQEHGYAVLSKTFAKENPPYAPKIENIEYLGLPFLEKYICVSDNKYIVSKTVLEGEWLV